MKFHNESALRALFSHSNIGIIITDSKGVILEMNPFAEKMFGFSQNESMGLSIEALLPHKIRDKHIGLREKYMEAPTPRAMGEGRDLEALHRNGHTFPVEVSLSVFKAGSELRIVSFINDITEKENYKRELEAHVEQRTKELSAALVELNLTNQNLVKEVKTRKEAQEQIKLAYKKSQELSELKTRFVSMASHEFRTPLAGIMTSLSLLRKYTAPEFEEKREKHFTRIKQLVQNLTSILNDFLSVDKLEQGGAKISRTSFELRSFVESIVANLSITALNEREIHCYFNFREQIVFLDQDFIRNILNNLITNAMKYSPDESHIDVRVSLDEQQVTIDVTDLGVGIPQDEQKHVFERFFRAPNVMTIAGTGLGLNIVKRYVELLNGSISFKSVEGEGSTFTVKLPL